jgi:pyridoxamine 5'-phosphate oxidase
MENLNQPEELEQYMWSLLYRSLKDHKRGFHYLNVATIDKQQMPQVRTVILRAVSKEANRLSFHTDARSRKMEHLAQGSAMSIHVYDKKSNLQVCFAGRPEVHHGDEKALQQFNLLHEGAVQLYRKTPGPMTPIGSAGAHKDSKVPKEDAVNNFVWVDFFIDQIEILHLGSDHHRKLISRPNQEPRYQWVVP